MEKTKGKWVFIRDKEYNDFRNNDLCFDLNIKKYFLFNKETKTLHSDFILIKPLIVNQDEINIGDYVYKILNGDEKSIQEKQQIFKCIQEDLVFIRCFDNFS